MNPPSADQEHLRLLATFHYIVGGVTMLFACLPLIHLGIGLAMLTSQAPFGPPASPAPPALFGWLLAALGAFFFLCGQALGVCTILSGRYLQRRRRYWFVFIVACVQCAFVPFGTALGVFTIIVLSRESVKALFAHAVPPPLAA